MAYLLAYRQGDILKSHLCGINDYTALHMAVAERNQAAVQLLLQAGADSRLRTRIDECETAREMAEMLAAQEARLGRA